MDTAEPRDVFVAGRVFLDIIFTGMLAAPSGGHEVWTDGMGSSPGGVANLAVACSRLGLSTTLSAAFGGDAYGEYCWRSSRSPRTSTSATPGGSPTGTPPSRSPSRSTTTARW